MGEREEVEADVVGERVKIKMEGEDDALILPLAF